MSTRAGEGRPAAAMPCQPVESFVCSVTHERFCASGGARLCCARGRVSMMIMGAPQCWHTKVGVGGRLSLWGECALG